MPRRLSLAPLLHVLALALLVGCRSGPGASTASVPHVVHGPAPVILSLPVIDAPLPPGVAISPPLRSDADPAAIPFANLIPNERTFPHNAIGANLAFTSNLRMPRLEAASIDPRTYQLRMRFSNASDVPLHVSLVCTYEGETRAAREVRRVEFPVNTFRDIAIDLQGDPSRKINIQATAVPVAATEGPRLSAR